MKSLNPHIKILLAYFPFFILLALNVYHLNSFCDLGDDFAQYIIHAQNILNLKPYAHGIDLEPNVIYPPGLPIILAPIIAIFGNASTMLKVPNVLFYFGTIFILFQMLKKHMSATTAYILCLGLAASSLFFFFKQHILSDIPFLFWITASAAMMQKHEKSPKTFSTKDWALAGLCFSMAMLTRSIGAALFLAVIIQNAVFRKNFKMAGGWTIMFLTVFCLQSLLLQGVHSDNFNTILKNISHYAPIIFQNIPVIFKSIIYILFPNLPSLHASSGPAHLMWNILAWTSYLSLISYLTFKLRNKNLGSVDIFLGIYFIVLVLWSAVPGGVNEFNRYVWPVIGLVLILLAKGFNFLKQHLPSAGQNLLHYSHLPKILLLILVMLNVLHIHRTFHYNNYFQADPANLELIDWITSNTNEDDHYIFFKSRLLAYLTKRIGTGWGDQQLTEDSLKERLKRLDIRYLITVQELEGGIISYLESRPDLYTMVWNNKFYKIFQTKTY